MVRREGLTEEDKEKLKQELLKVGLFALREAKSNAPVDTGRLRASITLADSEGKIQPIGAEAQSGDGVENTSSEFSIVLGTNVEYAEFIEFGTIKRAPDPFLRPAVDAAFQRFDIERT